MRADLAQASIVAKLVPGIKDNQARKVEKLTAKLIAAYGQQKRLKMQCEDQAVKIEKLRRLVWKMDCKTPPSYSLMMLMSINGTFYLASWGLKGLANNSARIVLSGCGRSQGWMIMLKTWWLR